MVLNSDAFQQFIKYERCFGCDNDLFNINENYDLRNLLSYFQLF